MQTDPPKALLAGGAACVSLFAGGSSADATCPDDPSGPRHRTLTNCTASEAGVDVALTVYALASETVVHDATRCRTATARTWATRTRSRSGAAPATGATVDLPVELTDCGGEDTRTPVKLVVGDEFDVSPGERTRRADADPSGSRASAATDGARVVDPPAERRSDATRLRRG